MTEERDSVPRKDTKRPIGWIVIKNQEGSTKRLYVTGKCGTLTERFSESHLQPTREKAEEVALLACLKFPWFMGLLEVRQVFCDGERVIL